MYDADGKRVKATVGITNVNGPGGVRVGFEFRMMQNRYVVTSYGTMMAAGGAAEFGRSSIHAEALLVSQLGFDGGNGMSGFQRAVSIVGASSLAPIAEVVP